VLDVEATTKQQPPQTAPKIFADSDMESRRHLVVSLPVATSEHVQMFFRIHNVQRMLLVQALASSSGFAAKSRAIGYLEVLDR